ncbi:MAG: TRAP transporter small permease [Pseudomonadota bacterium]
MASLRAIVSKTERVAAAIVTSFLAVSIGGAALLALSLIVFRNLINVSYNALEEISVYLILWMVFVGMAAAERTRSNISIDILSHALPPRSAAILQRIADALTALLALVLTWAAYDAVMFSRMINERAVSSLEVKIWPLMAIMPVAFALVAVRSGARALVPQPSERALESAH